ncbi:MAG: GNAT family N-acetyltransferase [Promethearchaeota archaeon]
MPREDLVFYPGKEHVKGVSEVLTNAFHEDSMFIYTIPNKDVRKNKLQVLFEVLVKYALKHGLLVASSSNLEGVMLCLRSEDGPISTLKMIECGAIKILFKLGINFIKKQEKINVVMDRLHETHAPQRHYYLWMLGVKPAFQGKGFGKKLLHYILTRSREKGIPCYLETVKEKNVKIYEHFGFKVMEMHEIKELNINIWAMLWEP